MKRHPLSFLALLLGLLALRPATGQAQKPELVVQSGHSGPVTCLAVSPNAKTVATGGEDGTVKLWEVTTGLLMRTLTGHRRGITSVAFSPDGARLASGSADSTAKLWDLATGRAIGTFRGFDGMNGAVNAVSFTTDGRSVVGGGQEDVPISLGDTAQQKPRTVRVWSATTGALLRAFPGSEALSGVRSVAVSPDGDTLAAAEDDGGPQYLGKENVVVLWSLSTGRRLRTLAGPAAPCNGVAFSPSGKLLGAACADKKVYLWDVGSGRLVRSFAAHDDPVTSVAFCGSDDLLLSASSTGDPLDYAHGDTLKLWDLKRGRQVRQPLKPGVLYITPTGRPPDGINPFSGGDENVAASRDGSIFASVGGQTNNTAVVWDRRSGALLDAFHGTDGTLEGLRFSPDGAGLLCGVMSIGGFNGVLSWDIRQGRLTHSQAWDWGQDIVFSADGRTAAREGRGSDFSQESVPITDLTSGKEVARLPGQGFLALSADGNLLAYDSSPRFMARSRQTTLLNRATGQHLLLATAPIWGAVFSPDGAALATFLGSGMDAADNTGVTVWDTRTGGSVHTFSDLPGSSMAFSPDGETLAVGLGQPYPWRPARPTDIVLRDLRGGPDRRLHLSGPAASVVSLGFSPDGNTLAAGYSDGRVCLWDVRTGRGTPLEGHAASVSEVAFSPDGRLLASASEDQTIRLWGTTDGRLLATFFALSPDDALAQTSGGYYSAARSASAVVAFRLGRHAYPFEQFDLRLDRPDLVLKALGSTDASLIKSYHAAYEKRLQVMGFTEAGLGSDFHLPVCTLTSDPPLTANSRALTFPVRASDTEDPLDRLQVFVNDVPANFTCGGEEAIGKAGLSLRGKPAKAFSGTVSLMLSAGANKVQVSALNSKGAESLKQTFTVTCTAPAARPDLYVLAVGVSQYPDASGLPRLNSADADAQAVTAFFTSQAGAYAHPPHVLTLLNGDATQQKILAARSLLRQSGVDDEVVVFLAGHGLLDAAKNYFYGTADISTADPAARGLSYDQIEGLLDGIPARRKLLLMDTCHAGEVDPAVRVTDAPGRAGRGTQLVDAPQGLEDAFDLQEDLFADLRRGSGATVIAAARGVETAGEDRAHGYFTQAVLDALAADPHQTVSRLQSAVAAQIARQTGGAQRPVARAENLTDDFPIVPGP